MNAQKSESYCLDPSFEHVVGVLCSTSPKFYGVIGYAVDPEAISQEGVRLLVRAAQAVAKETGRGPSDHKIVVQRIRRWVEEGKVTHKALDEAIDVLSETSTPSDEAQVVNELRAVIKRRMEAQAVRAAMEEYSRRGDFDQVLKLLQRARSVGTTDTSVGLRLGPGSFDEIRRMRHLDRMPFGIPELDMALSGGLPRGCAALFMAKSGGGKSMALSHVSADLINKSHFVAYATLELPPVEVMARVKANLTGVPISKILHEDEREAEERIEELLPTLGTFVCKSFPAKITTVAHIEDWIKELEQEEGYPCDLVVIDYIDKMASSNKNDRSPYEIQGTVAEEFRLFVERTGKWGLSASQARRSAGKEKNRRLDQDDMADSINKVRAIDLLVTINPDSSGEQYEYYVAKFRFGRGEFSVGPFPHDLPLGRLVVR